MRIYPALFSYDMWIKYVIFSCFTLVGVTCLASDDAAQGFLEGRLRILANKEVELAEGNTPKFSAENYADYPLIILSEGDKKEIVRVTADENGQYRVALAPGAYILDVQGRMPKGHLRAKPQEFKVISKQTVRVDMNVDTGVR